MDETASAVVDAPVRTRGFTAVRPWTLLRASRPRQWSKNVLVLAAPCAAGVIATPSVAMRVAGAFAAFCLLSSATYLANDVRDAAQDRLHPRKCLRPVAAGELSERTALLVALALALAGLALAAAVAPALAAVGVAYVAVTASYSLWWRRVVALDILAIAFGFGLRAVAGGAAAHVHLSRAFLLVAGSGAVFLVAGKRYAELRDSASAALARATLRSYSAGVLRALMTLSAAVAGGAYLVWATVGQGHGTWHLLSIAPFVLWLARYGRLVARGAGQTPEDTILADPLLLVLTAAWAALFVTGVYAAR
jgi:decaprenyl-phosphate phosphoribosyltransferase